MYYSREHNQYYYVDKHGVSQWVPPKQTPPPVYYESLTSVCVRQQNGSEYIHRLNERYEDITSVVLESAIIPNTQYLINNYSDRFKFNSTTCTIQHGNYSPEELAVALQALICTVDPDAKVVFSKVFHKFTFHSTSSEFEIEFDQDLCPNLGNILGFSGRRYTSTSRTLVSSDMVDFSGLQMVKIKIKEIGVIAHIPVRGSLIQYLSEPERQSRAIINPEAPLKTLTELTIQMLDSDDQPIDWEGGKHTLVFAIKSRKSRPRPFTQRGRR